MKAEIDFALFVLQQCEVIASTSHPANQRPLFPGFLASCFYEIYGIPYKATLCTYRSCSKPVYLWSLYTHYQFAMLRELDCPRNANAQ